VKLPLGNIIAITVGAIIVIAAVVIGDVTSKSCSQLDWCKDFPNPELGDNFPLEFNHSAFIESDNIEIKFIKVVEDTRCPPNVICILAGQVRILVDIMINGSNLGEYELVLKPGSRHLGKNVSEYTISFQWIEPLPGIAKIDESNYIAVLKISKME